MSHDFAASDGAIGKYRIIAQLGTGGMSEVFLTVSAGPGGVARLQVVKRLKKEMLHDPEMAAMFLDEARLSARFHHPNVVETNEIGEEDGRTYIAMEYLEGQSLHRICHEHEKRHGSPIPTEIHLRIIHDFLPGLAYMHALTDADGTPLNLVHRDISPHNIMVGYEGVPKIVDFGIAKAVTNANATRKGLFKGKIGYSAPEQVRGAKVGPYTDIYALGVMIWEAVAGKHMWEGEEDFSIAQRVLQGDLPALRALKPNAPEELVRICERALALEPGDRYPSVEALRKDLGAYLASAHHKATTDDVVNFVNKLLFSVRVRDRRTVEQKLAAFSADPEARITIVDMLPDMPHTRPSRADHPIPASPSIISVPPNSVTAPATAATTAARPNAERPTALIVMAGVLVAGGIAFWVFARPAPRTTGARTPVAVATEAEAPPPAPSVTSPPATTTTAAAPVPAPSVSVAAPPATVEPSAAPAVPSAAPVAPRLPDAAPPPTAAPKPQRPRGPKSTWDTDSPLLPP